MPTRAAGARADQRGLDVVDLEALAGHAPGREEALVDVGRARRGSGRTRRRRSRPETSPSKLWSRGRARRARAASRKAAQMSSPSRSIFIESRSRVGAVQRRAGDLVRGPARSSPPSIDREQRPVGDQVGVAADRRGEVRVGGAARARRGRGSPRCSGRASSPAGPARRGCWRRGRGARPRRATSALASTATCPASLGPASSPIAGVGTSREASWSIRKRTRAGSGCSWTR